MQEQMMQGTPAHMLVMWPVLFLALTMIIGAVLFLARRAPSDQILVSDLAGRQPRLLSGFTSSVSAPVANASTEARDTIFILPDISNYTRFMTGNQFAFGHAQHVVFSLINAMIKAGCKTVELSKLEGDAALFFVDAKSLSNAAVGQTVMDIFAAFFRTRACLIQSNICPCSACRQISELDLKIFVHRGRASRFEFRGAIDHFGTDVIILHRMMKNGIRGQRYVMVTEGAEKCIELPAGLNSFDLVEFHEHIGKVHAKVFEVSDSMVESMSKITPHRTSQIKDIASKFRVNWANGVGALTGLCLSLRRKQSGN